MAQTSDMLVAAEDHVSILYIIHFDSPHTFSGCFCGGLITSVVCFCCCVGFSVLVCGSTALFFTCAAADLLEDLGADFLYMEVGFFPVPKKAAPTKILGLGFMLLKEMVMAFLGSVGLLLVLLGTAAGVGAGLVVVLLEQKNKFK